MGKKNRIHVFEEPHLRPLSFVLYGPSWFMECWDVKYIYIYFKLYIHILLNIYILYFITGRQSIGKINLYVIERFICLSTKKSADVLQSPKIFSYISVNWSKKTRARRWKDAVIGKRKRGKISVFSLSSGNLFSLGMPPSFKGLSWCGSKHLLPHLLTSSLLRDSFYVPSTSSHRLYLSWYEENIYDSLNTESLLS